jgi:CSLREA domain-containing protein
MKNRTFSVIEPLESRIAPAFAPVIELSGLNGTNGIRINGEGPGRESGFSVSDAGDVNADGIDDLLISGIPDGSTGTIFVVFGTVGIASNINLASLDGTNGFRITGAEIGNDAGYSVAAGGDFNGDGFGDILVGAPNAGVNGEGFAYVIYGKSTPFAATFSLGALTAATGMRLSGVEPGSGTGTAVAAADVNGDGVTDAIVGAPFAGASNSASGAVYVAFGGVSNPSGIIGLGSLDGTNGFSISGENAGDNLGRFLNAAGDFNGDGTADFVIGAPFASPNGAGSGAAYVIFGRTTGFSSTINLSTLNGTAGLRVNGVAAGDNAGAAVHGAGDINADGIADLAIGAPGADPNGAESGAAYVIFGKTSPFSATLELSALNGTNGFKVSGAAGGDRFGSVVSGLGDINGDGIGDLLITAPAADPNGADSGAAYVVFGKGTAFTANVDVTGLNGLNGFKINGVVAQDHAGFSGSRARDFNADGIPDLFIGTPDADANGIQSGAGYVIFGMRERLVVTTAADTVDPGDGVLSLREAIQIANGQAGLDFIDFNIPGTGVQTITVATALPVITDEIVIDGLTQPGASGNTNGPGQGFNSVLLIQLLGAQANSLEGLRLAASDCTIRGLVISNFELAGIRLAGFAAQRNLIEGNFIGTNAAGTAARGNDEGVLVNPGSSNNTIRGNLISGNLAPAVTIFGDIEGTVSGNRIVGNLIGTDKSGLVAIPNDEGVVIFNNAIGNFVGGPTDAERNVISGNDGEGLTIFGAPGGGRPANNNVIQNNYIGVDVTGNARLANNGDGIDIFAGASGNQILDNVISGNIGDGVDVFSSAVNTIFRGNRIGTNAAGTAAIGNNGVGIALFSSAHGTLIGAGGLNQISGNLNGGISVSTSIGVEIAGNLIGTAANGVDPLGNGSSGIAISDAGGVIIGGVEVGLANTIASNDGNGIEASGATNVSISGNFIFSNAGHGIKAPQEVFAEIRQNSIFNNGLLGIDRELPTNALPMVTSSIRNGGGFAQVGGGFTGTPSSTYDVEVFTNFVADPSGFGEGKDYIGRVSVSTNADGNATFAFTSAVPVAAGQFVTVTVTDSIGNTTSFSNASFLSTSVVWTGAVSEDWFNAGNWSPFGVPTSGDSVIFQTASTLRLPADATVTNFTMKDGLFTGLGTLTINGLFNWTGGTMAGLGTTNANGGILMNGGEVTLEQRTLNIASDTIARLTGDNALLRLRNGAILNNAGSFLAENDRGILDDVGLLSVIRNTGSFTRSVSSADFLVDVPFLNEGTVQISTGGLLFGNGFVQPDTGKVLGPGAVTFTGGIVAASGTIGTDVRNTGALFSPGGLKQAGTLTIQGGYAQSGAGRLAIDIAGTTPGSEFDLLTINGPAVFNGTLEVNTIGAFVLQPDTNFAAVTYQNATGDFSILDAPSGVSTQVDSMGLSLLAQLPAPGQKSFEFTDVDGDVVVVKVNKGTIPDDAFTIGPNGELQLIDLRSVGSQLKGATVTISVQQAGEGNGTVNIGAINATGLDLNKIIIDGDLGQIDIGTGVGKKAGLKNLVVGSLGAFGGTTQVPGTFDPLVSDIAGAFGKLTVKGNVQDAIVNVTGKLGKVKISGGLGGGNPVPTLFGLIADLQRLIPRVSGGVPTGSFNAGSVGTFSVDGDVMGGSVNSNGDIGSVNVGGDLNSGAITSEGMIKNVKVVGSLVSDDPNDPAVISALARLGGT